MVRLDVLAIISLQFDCSILSFVSSNLPLVLELGQSRRPLLVHLLLQVLSLHSVLLVHLLQDVQLVRLPRQCLLGRPRLELSVLLRNGRLHLLPLVVLEPVAFALHLLLEKDVLFTRLVDVLEQVDSGLVLSLPLRIPHFVLSIGFFGNFLVH